MPFKPILLKGHTRNVTHVTFNRENDLLFTCAKDKAVNVWYTSNGERLGTFDGHNGAILECDVSYNSKRLITASADMTMKLWDVYSGRELTTFKGTNGIVKSCGFATGDTMALAVQASTKSDRSTIYLYNIPEEGHESDPDQDLEPVRELSVKPAGGSASAVASGGGGANFNRALWSSLNSYIYSCDEDGYVRKWNVEEGEQAQARQFHKKSITFMTQSEDKNLLLTASSDKSAKLIDTRTFDVVKSFSTSKPLNACAISPLLNHVILAGGQEAIDVTLSAASAGHFEVDFWHIVYEEFLGEVRGHFGPVNTLAFSPNGKMFASGSEDGYVRLHHFDQNYLSSTY